MALSVQIFFNVIAEAGSVTYRLSRGGGGVNRMISQFMGCVESGECDEAQFSYGNHISAGGHYYKTQ